MPSRKIEQQLEKLSELRAHARDGETLAALRQGLANPVNVVAAKAAKIAADFTRRDLLPDLLAAYHRMFENPRQTDPQCWGKNALAKALKDLGHAASEDFLRGLTHVQMEPVWGGEEDTATVSAARALSLWCSVPILLGRKLCAISSMHSATR